jgi:hypothetical protein
MNLAQRDQRPEIRASFLWGLPRCTSWLTYGAEFTQERGAVAFDGSFGVVFGESEIERALAICGRESSHPCGKSVDEPGKFAEVAGAKNVEFRLLRNAIRHSHMLPEASSER